jgi:DNA invertase Pin-like site-specific DNA recombinase
MIMERIKEAEAGFRSLSEAIDTTTAPGRMMMQMVGAFAEFERAILRERTKTGLDAARKQGRIGGRRPKLRPNQQDEIVAMVSAGTKTAADAARLFAVHPATVSRLLARAGAGAYRCEGLMSSHSSPLTKNQTKPDQRAEISAW